MKQIKKIVIAPNYFKEALSAKEAARAIARGIREVLPKATVDLCPLADGGDGTLDAYLAAIGSRPRTMRVSGPLGEKVYARYALSKDRTTAIIEMAKVAGLVLVPPHKRNPLKTTTFGLGEMIGRLANKGIAKYVVGIGGSATVDGGVGMAMALGYRFLDRKGRSIKPGGGGLSNLESIVPPEESTYENLHIVVASDVTNPLLGSKGAAGVYGPQKGASPRMVETLEHNLSLLARICKRDIGRDFKKCKGAGAAGGLGFGFMTFLNATIGSGIEMILDLVDFESRISDADLIITGEGKIDAQTSHGKVISGVGEIAKKHGLPVIALAGQIGGDMRRLHSRGIKACFAISDRPMSLEQAMAETSRNLRKTTAQIIRLLTSRSGDK